MIDEKKWYKRDHKVKLLFGGLYIIICIIIMVQIVLSDCFWYDKTSGDPYVQSKEEYTCELTPGGMHIRQVFKPTNYGLKEMAIRIENINAEEMKGDLKFEIYQDKKLIYSYMINHEDIVDWTYYSVEVRDCKLKKNKKYTVDISCVSEEETSPYRLYLMSNSLKENILLSYNEEEIDEALDITYVYNIYDFKLAVVLLTVLIMTIIMMAYHKKLKTIIIKVDYRFRIVVSFIVHINVNVLLLQYYIFDDIYIKSIYVLLANAVIILFLDLVLYFVFHRIRFSFICNNILVFLLGVLNHYIIQFRGNNIIPADIYSIGTAINVAENYKIEIYKEIIISTILLLFICYIYFFVLFGIKELGRIYIFIILVINFILVYQLSTNTSFQNRCGLNLDQSAQTYSSYNNGYLVSFAENIQYTILKKPKDYSTDKVKDIINSTAITLSSASEKAENVIIIMNESFTDLTYLGEIQTNEEVLDNFYSIANEENAKTGKCVVPVFGGGTSCSEFECITGCSMLYLGGGNAPYQQYIHTSLDSIVTNFTTNGYESVAIHLANPASWNRYAVYPLLGFNKFISSKSIEYNKVSFCRYWADDKSLYTELYNQLNKATSPIFEFGLTIQCHGGYNYSENNFQNTIDVSNINESEDELEQYLTLLDSTDEEFGIIINELKNTDEKTIVLMFGDHLPGLSESFYKELKGTDEWGIERYETPYILWANYDVDFSDMPDIISTNFIAPYLLKYAGLDVKGYYAFLYELSKKYPVVSRNGIIDKDGNELKYDIDSSCYEDIHNYEMVQYSILKGTSYD